MPHLRSLYPDLPPLPDRLNVYETIIAQSHHNQWPEYVVHAEEETGKTRTFGELRRDVNDLSAALAGPPVHGGLGLKAGDEEVIGIVSDNSSDYVVLVLALLKIAVPFALISSHSTIFEFQHAFRVGKVTKLFVASRYLSRAASVALQVSIARKGIYVMNNRVNGYGSLADFFDKGRNFPAVRPQIVAKDTPAFLLFSSGTTGLPKAVINTHGGVLSAFRQGVSVQQHRMAVEEPPTLPTEDGLPVTLVFLPMNHAFGLHINCIRAFIIPTRFIILRRWNVDKALKAIPMHKVTNLSMVPSMYGQIVGHPDFDKTDLSSIIFAQNAAAHLPQETLTRFLEQTPKIAFFGEGYGMSEVTALSIVRPFPGTLDGRFKYVPGALGVLFPGMEARIVREDGSDADFNEVGELWLKGETVVAGYLNDPEATENSFVDGWLRTGDSFKVDEGHYFYFVDRMKDTIKVSGAQVSPAEIEQLLMTHPQRLVSDATVAGVSIGAHGYGEKIPRAWVMLTESGKKLGAVEVIIALEKWHREHLSKYKWLRGGIEVVEEIPRSPIGKPLRRVLQEEHERRITKKAKL